VKLLRPGSELVRSITFGALDGILSSFAIVASVYGSTMAANVVLLIGMSTVLAEGLSMGVGDLISSRAVQAHQQREKRKNREYIKGHPRLAASNMIQYYVDNGIRMEDASSMVAILSKPKYRDVFAEHMMEADNGEAPPSRSSNLPVRAGFAMFLSYAVFGSLPILPYLVFVFAKYEDSHGQFAICAGATAGALFVTGAVQVRFFAVIAALCVARGIRPFPGWTSEIISGFSRAGVSHAASMVACGR
jgi:VIT1/CCC1 family predicted Fe2+/Mn2+ transporter